jgi:hypothetical protein
MLRGVIDVLAMNPHGRTDADLLREAGITNAHATFFLKQYGERRTCTNAMRAIVTNAFDDTFVLMHVLGDKHTVPSDLAQIWQDSIREPDPSWHFVSTATFGVPSATTVSGDYYQLRFTKALSEPVYRAYAERRFGIMICTKHPYNWASSLMRYRRWPAPIEEGSWEERFAIEFLRSACRGFNKKHLAWLTLRDESSVPSIVIRSEALAAQPEAVVQLCQERFHLKRRTASSPLRFDAVFKPTSWDFIPTVPDESVRFTGVNRPHLLSKRLLQVIDDHIDWVLMQRINYTPEMSGSVV